jgi:hypothetical protein
MQKAKSVPQINGRDLQLVALSGPAGAFEIAATGTRKDGEATVHRGGVAVFNSTRKKKSARESR